MISLFKLNTAFPKILTRSYKKVKGVAAVSKKKQLDCETDAKKLIEFCHTNYRVDEEPIHLKADSEYPDWLWKLRTIRAAPPLSQCDRNTFSYWRRVRQWNRVQWNRLAKIDGWHKQEHHRDSDLLSTFYGDWHLRLKQWQKANAEASDKL